MSLKEARVSRRYFLGWIGLSPLGLVACASTLRATVPPHIASLSPTTEPPTPAPTREAVATPTEVSTQTPVPTLAPTPETEMLRFSNIGDVYVAFNSNSVPVKYKLGDGVEVPIDQRILSKAKAKALETGEPEIAMIVPIEGNTEYQNFIYSNEHPQTEKLPEDTLSDEELKARGIKIVQGNRTNLFIRKGAFKKEALFESLQPGSGRKLNIVLVDGPVVASVYMKDKKYDGFRKRLKVDELDEPNVETYKNEQIKVLEQRISIIRQKLKELKQGNPRNQDEIASYEYMLASQKAYVYEYQNILTDDELTDEIYRDSSEAAGMYFMDIDTLFVAVGESKKPRKILIIMYAPDGGIAVSVSERVIPALVPRANQTYPNPRDFPKKPSASPDKLKSYAFGGVTPGFSLRHESEHNVLIGEAYRTGRDANFSEYDTDIKAMEGIIEAHTRWVKSGYSDNSGYYFIFSLPEGGYILTKSQESKSQLTT